MRKHQLVSTALIVALLGSNMVIGNTYIKDQKESERKFKQQANVIEKYQLDLKNLNKIIKTNNKELNDLHKQNNDMQTELDKVIEENNKLKQIEEQYRQLEMELTFYTADCNGCSGVTKTGIDVTNSIYYKGVRIIATDPKVIPLHSIVKIETEHETYYAYAADTGGAIKGNILDVLVASEKEAFTNGRQTAMVTIIREGDSNL